MQGERGDRMVLVGDGDRARFFKLGQAGRAEPDATRTMVLFILRARDQSAWLHARKCGTDRIRIARHEIGQRALREPLRIGLTQPAQDAELIRRDPKMFDSIAKALVQPTPRPAEQDRQPLRRRWRTSNWPSAGRRRDGHSPQHTGGDATHRGEDEHSFHETDAVSR